MKEFKLTNEFVGYHAKRDKSALPFGALTEPSKNVLINDSEKVAARKGFTLYGAANAALFGITGSTEWRTQYGTEFMLRGYDDELEFNYNGTWYRLKDGFTSTNFQFTLIWDETESKELLLLCNGTTSVWDWSGAVAEIDISGSSETTLKKTGTATWAESGFLLNGTRSVTINGTVYTYTGGEGTTTLTGLSTDPTSEADGSLAFQTVRENDDYVSSSFNVSLLGTHRNQVWAGDLKKRVIYISKNDDWDNFSAPSAPRAPGEGAQITLDSTPVGFVAQEDAMYVSGRVDDWYRSTFQLSSDLQNETLDVDRLQSGADQGAQSQSLIGKIKNSIVYISNEPTFDTLGRVENIDTPQSVPLSDAIKAEFDTLDFTGGHIKYFKNRTYITVPAHDRLYIFDHARGFWQPPQTGAFGRMAVFGNELYFHSSVVPETYKMFDSTSDNDAPIEAVATFAYQNFGYPAWQKQFNEWFTEGYISENTELELDIQFEYRGVQKTLTKTIDGSDSTIIFDVNSDGSLGSAPLGENPLGGIAEADDNLAKFRVIHTATKTSAYEWRVTYKTYGQGQEWELLRFGANASLAKADNNHIKK